jgi:hypothetical protein
MTLDEGLMSRHQWIQAILLVESFKLVPMPLDEGPRPKSGKLRLNLHGTCFGGKSIGSDQKTLLKWELLIWRTKNEARDQGTIQLKDSICFKAKQSKLVPRKLDPGPLPKVGLSYVLMFVCKTWWVCPIWSSPKNSNLAATSQKICINNPNQI